MTWNDSRRIPRDPQELPAPRLDPELVRERLTFAEVAVKDGLVVIKRGTQYVASCPFHDERTSSFVIGGRGKDRAKCFGCGWGGDFFSYWMARHGVTFPEAVSQLGALCGLTAPLEGVGWRQPKAKVVTRVASLPADLQEKPALPPLRAVKDGEIEHLARLRGLSPAAVRVAAQTFRRIGMCEWPLWRCRRDGRWRSTCLTHGWKCGLDREDCAPRERWPSWVVTDEERRVAEFRRLDGGRYPVQGSEGIKAWSTSGKSWPIGAAEMGRRRCVLLVEGGPDILAAYHFLWGWGLLDRVAVVGMLGASARIAEKALAYFKGAKVRIMMDADEAKGEGDKRRAAGCEAAARWTEQLTGAGAVVETFSLYGLTRADGEPVKDLNDLALCTAEVVDSREITEAFFDWEF